MVDASQFGTVCLEVRSSKDADTIFAACVPGGESLVLAKDLNLSLEFIDEGKSLVLIDKQLVNNQAEARAELAKIPADASGKYERPVKVAFCNMGAMNACVGQISSKLKEDDEKKKMEEAAALARLPQEEAAAAAAAAEEEELIIKEKLSYKLKGNEWVEPDTTADDVRKGDARYVAGGAPQALGVDDSATIKKSEKEKKEKPVKQIVSFMAGEPDPETGILKIYVEEPGVVNADKQDIHVEFLNTSFSIRVETPTHTLLLPPRKCGQVNTRESSWKLSAGKRLTITLVPGAGEHVGDRKREVANAMKKVEEIKEKGKEGEADGLNMMAIVAPILVLILAVAAMFVLQQK